MPISPPNMSKEILWLVPCPALPLSEDTTHSGAAPTKTKDCRPVS